MRFKYAVVEGDRLCYGGLGSVRGSEFGAITYMGASLGL